MTTLKEFVMASLRDVSEALQDFEQSQKENGRNITPFPIISTLAANSGNSPYTIGKVFFRDENGEYLKGKGGEKAWQGQVIMPIEFNIAVTAVSGDQTDAGVGLKVLEAFRVGTDVKTSSEYSSASRVTFVVPLQLARSE